MHMQPSMVVVMLLAQWVCMYVCMHEINVCIIKHSHVFKLRLCCESLYYGKMQSMQSKLRLHAVAETSKSFKLQLQTAICDHEHSYIAIVNVSSRFSHCSVRFLKHCI
jgi:hypothetical protein